MAHIYIQKKMASPVLAEAYTPAARRCFDIDPRAAEDRRRLWKPAPAASRCLSHVIAIFGRNAAQRQPPRDIPAPCAYGVEALII